MASMPCWTSRCVDQVVLSLSTQWTWLRKIGLVEMGSFWDSSCQCFSGLCHGSASNSEESGKETFSDRFCIFIDQELLLFLENLGVCLELAEGNEKGRQ